MYRALRAHGGYASLAGLRKTLGGSLDDGEIDYLRSDFDVEMRLRGKTPSCRLGERRAFRGQEDHAHPAAFATERLRSTIS
ncbi:hypothetical protein ACMYYO_00415 [Dermacoccaceae bacterium W4C1]